MPRGITIASQFRHALAAFHCVLFCSLGFAQAPADAPATSQVEQQFQQQVQPLLKKYCYRCHNEQQRESGIRLDPLMGDLNDRDLKLWKGIRRQLSEEAMPPEDEPQPSAAERQQLVTWIDAGLQLARTRKRPRTTDRNVAAK